MRKKTKALRLFLDNLHKAIISNPQFRKDVSQKTEVQIQAELRPVIISYLESYFKVQGYKDYIKKAHNSFYWEGQEGRYKGKRNIIFASRNYPDFIITAPYLVAVEYKQSKNGSVVKHAVGQSIMHTLSEDYDFVYVLFHDENKDKKIEKSFSQDLEQRLSREISEGFNVFLRMV